MLLVKRRNSGGVKVNSGEISGVHVQDIIREKFSGLKERSRVDYGFGGWGHPPIKAEPVQVLSPALCVGLK